MVKLSVELVPESLVGFKSIVEGVPGADTSISIDKTGLGEDVFPAGSVTVKVMLPFHPAAIGARTVRHSATGRRYHSGQTFMILPVRFSHRMLRDNLSTF